MGFELPITIDKVIQGIQENKYVLPAIQREFVWSEEQIQKLFDSLMRGYPIGSFLFWEIQPGHLGDFQFYKFMDHYHEKEFRHNPPIDLLGSNAVTAVLDGQQRLTALYIGLNGWYASKLPYFWWNNPLAFPPRKLYINLANPPQDLEYAYEFKMLQDKEVDAKDPNKHWFRVGDVLKFPDMQSVFFYCVQHGLTSDKQTFPSSTLMELWRVVKEKALINYFKEEEQNLDKVLNIFIRVNSGGTVLSYSDMLLSIATAAWKQLDAREVIYGLVEELNQIGDGFQFNKDDILKACLVLNDIPGIEFRINNFTRDTMKKIEEGWETVAKALRLTVQLLAGWGYNRQTLVSSYATIPLAYYIHKIGNPTNFVTSSQYASDRDCMRRWMQIAFLKRTFSGQPDNVLRPIRKVILDHSVQYPFDQIRADLIARGRSMDFDAAEIDGLLSYRYGHSHIFSILSILYPWLKYDQQFHVDHIFPRAMFTEAELKKRHIPEADWGLWLDHVNDLANLQLLQGPANMSKSDQEFEAWVRGECPTPKDLKVYKELHLIPDVSLAFEDFPGFLQARAKLIRQQLAENFGVQLPKNGQNGLALS
jgi:hypothetical protein